MNDVSTSYVVAVVGPQGAGKSTICRALPRQGFGGSVVDLPAIVYGHFFDSQPTSLRRASLDDQRAAFLSWTRSLFSSGPDGGLRYLLDHGLLPLSGLVVLDGLHNPMEIDLLRGQVARVLVVAVWAPRRCRLQRVASRIEDPLPQALVAPRSQQELLSREDADHHYIHQSPPASPPRCLLMEADSLIVNDMPGDAALASVTSTLMATVNKWRTDQCRT